MRRLDLREYERSEPVALSSDERTALARVLRGSLTIEPAAGKDGVYHLTPGSTIGSLEVNGLSVSIRPKLPVSRVLFLASYAAGRIDLQDRFDFRDDRDIVEVLALQLAAAARRAFAAGLLHGYRTEQEALPTVRGRIRVDEQIRRRFGVPLPLEVQYDEFTDDITANRLVKAAAARLARMRIRAPRSRAGLAWVDARLDTVSPVEYAANAVPEIVFDRLNGHYRQVVALSRLILRQRSFEAERGGIRASGFLMDMNVIFQEFVTRALRDALQVSDRVFRSDEQIGRITLDVAGRVWLKPDLTWWDGGDCTFAGDVKYKRIENAHAPNADLYQLLAYATALDLPGGLLIYAQGEQEPAAHRVRHAGKLLEVAALDLSGTPEALLDRIAELAKRVRAMRAPAAAPMRMRRQSIRPFSAGGGVGTDSVGSTVERAVALPLTPAAQPDRAAAFGTASRAFESPQG